MWLLSFRLLPVGNYLDVSQVDRLFIWVLERVDYRYDGSFIDLESYDYREL